MRNNEIICDVELYSNGVPIKYIEFTMAVPDDTSADEVFKAIQAHAKETWKNEPQYNNGGNIRVKNIWVVGQTNADISCSA